MRGFRGGEGGDGRHRRQRAMAGSRRRSVCGHGGPSPGRDDASTRRGVPPAMIDSASVAEALRAQRIELPSWAFGNSGTRFKVFAQAGVPRTAYEKVDDAAQVAAHTGLATTVALHIPWDNVDDFAALAAHAKEQHVAIGTINSNVFQDDDYRLGSVCHPDTRVRRKAIEALLHCVDVMDATGSGGLKLWFADGTNYPGQDSISARQGRLREALLEVYERLGS